MPFYFFDCIATGTHYSIEKIKAALSGLIKKTSINLQDANGYTMVHYAIKTLTCARLKEILPILIDHHANIHIRNHANQTPLHSFLIQPRLQTESYSDNASYRKVLADLLNEIDINTPDNSGITPLFLAAHVNVSALIPIRQRQLKNVGLLNTMKGFVSAYKVWFFNAKNNQDEDNLLHAFVTNWKLTEIQDEAIGFIAKQSINEKYKFILELQIQDLTRMNFSLNSKNSEGKTPLQIAIDRNVPALVEALLANGARTDNLNIISARKIIDLFKTADAFDECQKIISGAITVQDKQEAFDKIKSKGLGRRLVMRYISDPDINLSNKSAFISSVLTSNFKGKFLDFYDELAVFAYNDGTSLIKYEDILLILKTNVQKQLEGTTCDAEYLRRCSRAKKLHREFLDNSKKDDRPSTVPSFH